MKREEPKITPRGQLCCVCQGYIKGIAGVDFQYVKTVRGTTHYYCAKCVREIAKGG